MLFSMFSARLDICALSLHDALPIYPQRVQLVASDTCQPRNNPFNVVGDAQEQPGEGIRPPGREHAHQDRKSTRLNSSHPSISYAVFCLKKKILRGTTCNIKYAGLLI